MAPSLPSSMQLPLGVTLNGIGFIFALIEILKKKKKAEVGL